MALPLLKRVSEVLNIRTMSPNEVNLKGTVISLSEGTEYYEVRIYCKVQIIDIKLSKEYRKPELGQDIVLSGHYKIREWSPHREEDQKFLEN